MRPVSRRSLLLVLSALAACSGPSGDAARSGRAQDSGIPTDMQVQRFLAEGPEPTLRKLSATDYWLHYKLMQASGIERELGGEAQAVAALQAIGNAYARALRGAEADAPRMIPAAFTGEGMASGFLGMGMGGFAGLITGGVLSGGVASLSDERLAELVKAGPITLDGQGGRSEFRFAEDGSMQQQMTIDVNEQGVNGQVRINTRMDACPDADGKVRVHLEVESRMSVSGKPGTGGFVHSELDYARYLDDDAHLIADGSGAAATQRIRMGGSENFHQQQVDITLGRTRAGETTFQNNGESGYSIFRPDEVARTQELLQQAEMLQTLIAEAMLRGLGSPGGPAWESGRCVKLTASSSPAKRKGIKPNTAFDLQAQPRARADGRPTGGTVTATLNGGAHLQQAGIKVPADAKYEYAGPAQKNEQASIAFEARSKRGVGRATLDFDTRLGGYRIVLENGDVITTCDITKPFSGKIVSGMVTLSFTPGADGKSGKAARHFAGGGGVADTAYNYTLSGPEERMTGAFHANSAICGQAAGLKRCAIAREQTFTSTWIATDVCDG